MSIRPRAPVNVVQTYIKRLRRMLEPDRQARSPSMLLPSVPGGYALVGDPDTVDIWRSANWFSTHAAAMTPSRR